MKVSFIQSDWKGYSTIYAILSTNEGIGQLDIEYEDDQVVKTACLYNLQVKDTLRGKGYGRMIVEALEERAKAYGIIFINLTVNADSSQLIEWYKGLGYKVASKPFIFPNTGEVRIRMSKELKYMDYDDDGENVAQDDVFRI